MVKALKHDPALDYQVCLPKAYLGRVVQNGCLPTYSSSYTVYSIDWEETRRIPCGTTVHHHAFAT